MALTIDQVKLDRQIERNLSKAQREYRFMSTGQQIEDFGKPAKYKRKVKLEKMKAEVRAKNLETHLKHTNHYANELKLTLKVANGFPYNKEEQKNFRMTKKYLEQQEEMNKEIVVVRKYNEDLKSQLNRLHQAEQELIASFESEHKYYLHIKKANHQLEVFENKLQIARQNECHLTTENQKLLATIQGMLCDRALFNSYWKNIVRTLSKGQKFLIDMIERSKFAFNQSEELCLKLDALRTRATRDKNAHIQDILNTKRKIDADSINHQFLGGKGKHRKLFELEEREVNRRMKFKEDYSNKLNLYRSIIEDIKRITNTTELRDSMNFYNKEDNKYFQHYNYLNEMNHQIEYLTSSFSKLKNEIDATTDYNSKKLEYFNEKIDEKNVMLQQEIENTLNLKDKKDQFENEIGEYLDAVTNILKLTNCDLGSLQQKLGNYKNVTIFNLDEFLSVLENRVNELIALVYCDQRPVDLTLESDKLHVRSMKRTESVMTQIEQVASVQQCAECAEGEDVNRYDDKVVYPYDHETIKERVHLKVEAPEMTYRLHNLSKCRLPRSRQILNRRYL